MTFNKTRNLMVSIVVIVVVVVVVVVFNSVVVVFSGLSLIWVYLTEYIFFSFSLNNCRLSISKINM